MARPTKLTPQVRERVEQAMRAGSYAIAACRAAGIAESTFYRWLERGEEEESGIYREFHDAIRKAEAEAEVRAAATVTKAMGSDWRAAIALLERRFPSRWRRHLSTELVGKDGGPIRSEQSRIDLTKLSEDDLKQLEEIYARAGDAG